MGMRRPSGLIAASAIAALALVLVSSTPAPANTTRACRLAPSSPRIVSAPSRGGWARFSKKRHFRRAPIDDKLSAQVYERYLDMLDSQRSYFLASDINEFASARLKFDDMIRTGELEPGYVIFARFQQRNKERINYALSLLKTEPNWTVNESFQFDREHTPVACRHRTR